MTIKIGKIRFNISFLFFAFAAYYLSDEMCKNYLFALFFSLLHELGHLVPMLLFGCVPQTVKIGAFGFVIEKSNSVLSYKNEFIISLCGPAVNLVLLMLFDFLSKTNSDYILPMFVNLGLLFVNLLPIGILDGGRMLHLLLSQIKGMEYADAALNVTETAAIVLLIICMFVSVLMNYTNTSYVFFVLAVSAIIVYNVIKRCGKKAEYRKRLTNSA